MEHRSVVKKVDLLSAFRIGLAMSIVGLIAWMVAVLIIYLGMDATGILASVNNLIGDVGGSRVINFGFVMGFAALIGAVFAIFGAVVAPLTALIYNMVHNVIGGLEVTVGELEENRG